MTNLVLNFLLLLSKLVKLQNFIIIIIFLITIGICYKKIKKIIFLIYILYIGIFLIFFTINEYGADIFTVLFLKKKLTSNSFIQLKNDIASKKTLKEKIIFSYSLSNDIKYQIKKLEEEINLTERKFNNTKGIDKRFIPWTDTADKV